MKDIVDGGLQTKLGAAARLSLSKEQDATTCDRGCEDQPTSLLQSAKAVYEAAPRR